MKICKKCNHSFCPYKIIGFVWYLKILPKFLKHRLNSWRTHRSYCNKMEKAG